MSHHDDNSTFDPKDHRWGYEINTGLLTVVGIASVILVYVIMVAVQATYVRSQDDYVAEKVWQENNSKIVKYEAAEKKKLENIDQAIDKVVAGQNN